MIVVFVYLQTEAIWVSLVVGGLLLLYLVLTFIERHKYERMIGNLSQAIQDIFEERPLEIYPQGTDDLVSKVGHQLQRLEETIINTKETARTDKENIQQLITDIAHQLRTPLGAIEGYLEILKHPTTSDLEKSQAIEALAVSQQKLAFLVESFIKMSRLESRLIQLKKEPVSLKETVLTAVFQLHKQAESKGLHIELKAEDNLVVPHDRNWLGEAIYNLLDNSIKYSHEHGKIRIELTETDLFTQIIIQDEGIGIQKGEEPLIFQRFYRGKTVSTQAGFGIGLYLTREIVNQHEGLMKVTREEPGLRVTVYLPK
ncbi:hypothetical protein BAU15_10365 [Enterococcus sp. JM4C]|nr:hypothetical protein BAU15_10365 [Enterococcus sp. JM4C]